MHPSPTYPTLLEPIYMPMKKLYLLSVALLLPLLLGGCFEEVAGPYDGPDQIAFEQLGGLYQLSVTDDIGVVPLPTQLIGPQRSEAFDVEVSVLTEQALRIRQVQQGDGTTEPDTTVLAEPTTAPAASYSVPSSYTFPADSSNVPVAIQINDGVLAAGETQRLSIRLDGNDDAGVVPAENWRYFQIFVTGQ